MRYLYIIIGLLCAFPAAAVCKWSDSQGQIHYGRHPPPGVACGAVANAPAAASDASEQRDGSGLRPSERALLQDIRQREQQQRVERRKARRQQRKQAARAAAVEADKRRQCEESRRRFARLREQRRKGYKLSQAAVLDQQMADAEQNIRTYCR